MDSFDPDNRYVEDDSFAKKVASYTAAKSLLHEIPKEEGDDTDIDAKKPKKILDDYNKRRFRSKISPSRNDAFAMGDRTPDASLTTYAHVMREHMLDKEKKEMMRTIADDAVGKKQKQKSRWDDADPSSASAKKQKTSDWDMTPVRISLESDATPTPVAVKTNRWDQTPAAVATPTPRQQKSKWDQTPYNVGVTPVGGSDLATPTPRAVQFAYKDMDERNRAFTDEELDAILPQEGYRIMVPPVNYMPIMTPARKLIATPTPLNTPFYSIPEENRLQQFDLPKEVPGNLPFMKPEDYQHFGALLNEEDEVQDGGERKQRQKEKTVLKLVLLVKNGTPQQRKTALKQLTRKAREFGAEILDCILPLFINVSLEDQERHLMIKILDRVLYKMDDLVRPFVHKILVVMMPLLLDADYYVRAEAREVISNLSKAAGLATMISVMRPDIDHVDEYVRNATSRTFAVVSSSLGIPALLPFLRAVCLSKKSWEARHTGIKIVQHIAILNGTAILPHLTSLVEIIKHGLDDKEQKVKMITALAVASLAEASFPYGFESFDSVLKPLWKGLKLERGKFSSALLKATGFIITLMVGINDDYMRYYTKEVMIILTHKFNSPDLEMRNIVLKVLKQCLSTDAVEVEYIRANILPDFFGKLWHLTISTDRRSYKLLVETTVEIADKVGVADVVDRIVEDLKSENEPRRRMAMETIGNFVLKLGASDINARLEELLVDGILYAFQEQTSDHANVMLDGFGAVVNAMGHRIKPYLPQICGTIKWRLQNKSSDVRQQAADLISRIAVVMQKCQEEQLLGHLGVVLYDNLREEYPEVLGSILGGLKAIVNTIGMTKMTPPVKDLVPHLTPILKNRHEKVQENCIDLLGRIADRGSEFVPARGWMRICFELLEVLKAHKKGIRRATVNTFGYIAKAIGPQDVLATLLNNLKVQDRQNRVCTTVAISIVAETCDPYTVLPSLINEYRVAELNVQNGVLKTLSFLFEYIGEMGRDYVYAVTPLLEDALMDRDLVHRQTAASVVKHMALGVSGLGHENVLRHLLNYVWPNIFETSPHLVNATMEAIEGIRVALGPAAILSYCLQGLFHPARKVREVYWKIYNSLYIGSEDSLVAAHPVLEDEGVNIYSRPEMMMFV